MRFAGKLPPEEFWRHLAAGDDRMRAAAHLLPLYGIAGWSGPVMTGGWQWSGGELESAGLIHGMPNESSLEVVATSGDPARIAHALRMTGDLERFGPPGSDAGLGAMRDRLAATPARPMTVSVAGQAAQFTRWDGTLRWHAAATLGAHGLVLEGCNLDPPALRLEPVTDIELYLAGRSAYLRRLRGEDRV